MISYGLFEAARDSVIETSNTVYSRGMPRAKPEMIRPSDMQSSIASSSASRSGSWIGKRFP